jgi:phosphatidate cytidylyltransferase
MPSPNLEIYRILASLLIAASLGSIIGYVLKRRYPLDQAVENLNDRVRSWWMMILVGGGALLAGRIAILLLFTFVSFLTLREFVTQVPVRRADHSALFICFFLALPIQYWPIGIGWYGCFPSDPVYCFPALAGPPPFTDTERFSIVAATQWPILCVYCISHIPRC